MDKTAILNGIVKIAKEAESGHKLAAAINAINTSVRITFIDGQHGKNSVQFNIEPSGRLTLHNIHLPQDLRGKGWMTKVLKSIRELPGLNGECHVALAINWHGWRTILQRAGFSMV